MGTKYGLGPAGLDTMSWLHPRLSRDVESCAEKPCVQERLLLAPAARVCLGRTRLAQVGCDWRLRPAEASSWPFDQICRAGDASSRQ
jgi:hypothetical protein